jgi:hypothetical protein
MLVDAREIEKPKKSPSFIPAANRERTRATLRPSPAN